MMLVTTLDPLQPPMHGAAYPWWRSGNRGGGRRVGATPPPLRTVCAPLSSRQELPAMTKSSPAPSVHSFYHNWNKKMFRWEKKFIKIKFKICSVGFYLIRKNEKMFHRNKVGTNWKKNVSLKPPREKGQKK